MSRYLLAWNDAVWTREDPSELVGGLIGDTYITSDEVTRAAWRERYCRFQLLFYPEAALDPRSDLSFLQTLSDAEIAHFEEVR